MKNSIVNRYTLGILTVAASLNTAYGATASSATSDPVADLYACVFTAKFDPSSDGGLTIFGKIEDGVLEGVRGNGDKAVFLVGDEIWAYAGEVGKAMDGTIYEAISLNGELIGDNGSCSANITLVRPIGGGDVWIGAVDTKAGKAGEVIGINCEEFRESGQCDLYAACRMEGQGQGERPETPDWGNGWRACLREAKDELAACLWDAAWDWHECRCKNGFSDVLCLGDGPSNNWPAMACRAAYAADVVGCTPVLPW